MKKLVTINGISLFKEGDTYYSFHPNKMMKLLTISSMVNPELGYLLSDITEIKRLKGIFIFSSSLGSHICVTILSTSSERAFKLVQRKFKEWGYKGIPILVL